MRILVVSPLLPSPAIAMRGLHTNEQFGIFRNFGHEIRATVPVAWTPKGVAVKRWRRHRAIPDIEYDHGVAIRHPRFLSLGRMGRQSVLHRLQRILYRRALAKEISDFLSRGGDIVHIHSCELPGVLADDIGSARLVISMHDDELFDVAPRNPEVRRSIRHALQSADAVVYVSKTLQEKGIELAGPHSGVVIPIGITEYPDISPMPSSEYTIVSAARLIRRKNVNRVIEAFGVFNARGGRGRLIIVGDGPERRSLQDAARQNQVENSVWFTGAVAHRRVVEILSGAHLFVLPSVREALGAVYFEAMSMHVPVIGTPGEGIADFVTDGKNGFLCCPEDVDRIAQIMAEMCSCPERREIIGSAGFALFDSTGMRWRDHVQAHIRLFDRLLQRDSQSSASNASIDQV